MIKEMLSDYADGFIALIEGPLDFFKFVFSSFKRKKKE